MSYFMDKAMEEGLVTVVNEKIDKGIYLSDYKMIEFTIYTNDVLNKIISKCKLKDIGTVSDFPRTLPQTASLSTDDILIDPAHYKRILVSKKYQMLLYYTTKRYYIDCTVLIESDMLDKFKKKVRNIILNDNTSSIFRKNEFECKEKEFIELCATNDEKKIVDVVRKTVPDENLVFDKDSTITEVMEDINTFFKEETKELYKKLHIAYKRGVILYGDPGNGKSAMIREIIRNTKNVSKVIINPNVKSVTRILESLIKSMDGSPVMIIMEDIDSIISNSNRSELLNILDGVDVKSGVFFIGTTNYYEKIDPAFMNRSGRFDRTYKINNPTEAMRRMYFESRDVDLILSDYHVYRNTDEDKSLTVIDLFVKYSEDLPMANLKELITSTCYLLATKEDITVNEAIQQSSERIKGNRKDHVDSHNEFITHLNGENFR